MMKAPPIAVSTWNFGLNAVKKAAELATQNVASLDVIEQAIRLIEDDPEVTSVGYGGLPNSEGVVELDASIFDGPLHKMGAVACLEGIRNPISVARLIMEKTPHVMLAGKGAQEFAIRNGFQIENLLSENAKMRWLEWKQNPTSPYHVEPFREQSHDTVCLLFRDAKEDLYGGCSTSGLAWKMPGRIGDTPLIGSGLYVDNQAGAAAATGVGEAAIAECAAHSVVQLLRDFYDPEEACAIVLHRILKKENWKGIRQLALIALRKDGKFGFSCLSPRFQAAVYYQGISELIDVTPIQKNTGSVSSTANQ